MTMRLCTPYSPPRAKQPLRRVAPIMLRKVKSVLMISRQGYVSWQALCCLCCRGKVHPASPTSQLLSFSPQLPASYVSA